jgi:NADPH:quinone reductase-like Zn-dependent oxidoreductase
MSYTTSETTVNLQTNLPPDVASLTLTTRSARVSSWGSPPRLLEVPAPAIPEPLDDRVQIRVSGACLHSLVRARASGKHYSVKALPHTLGVDGVGVLANGQHVYFTTFEGDDENTGSFVEAVNVAEKDVFPLPEKCDPWQIAALVNPAMSSWMALRRRAIGPLPHEFSVLIMGATTMSGRLAVPILRRLGAGKIIGCARNEAALKTRTDLDEAVVLKDDVEQTDFSAVGHVDVVLDYVFGKPAEVALKKLQPTRRMQWIQIGSLAGGDIAFAHAFVRSKDLIFMGAGIGSWSLGELREELPELLQVMKNLPHQAINVVPMEDVETEWAKKRPERTVLKF